MMKKILIESTTSAVNKLITIENWNIDGSVFLYGDGLGDITETVNIQIQTVAEPDIDNDDHWVTFVYDSDSYVLNSTTFGQSISCRGTYRISKPASNTAFGVRFE